MLYTQMNDPFISFAYAVDGCFARAHWMRKILNENGFRNEYDGHTLDQHEQLTGKRAKTATVDRGYRGKSQIGDTIIQIPQPFNDKKLSRCKQNKQRQAFRNRAAIESIIGHTKADHRRGRNFYKGIVGDNIKVMLTAAAFNFKRMINKWKASFLILLQRLFWSIKYLKITKTILN